MYDFFMTFLVNCLYSIGIFKIILIQIDLLWSFKYYYYSIIFRNDIDLNLNWIELDNDEFCNIDCVIELNWINF